MIFQYQGLQLQINATQHPIMHCVAVQGAVVQEIIIIIIVKNMTELHGLRALKPIKL